MRDVSRRYYAAVRSFRPDFHRLWLAQTISLLGDYLAMYAVQAAIVFGMHGTARQTSGVFLAALLPTALVGPFAGVFADRWNAGQTMVISDVIRAVLVAALVFAEQLWQIYAVSFAVSCVSAFFTPAFAITVPKVVEPGQLLKANACLQQSMNAARILSPAMAGGIAALVGVRSCYWADSASFLISAALISTLPADATRSVDAQVGGPVLHTPLAQDFCGKLRDGIRCVSRNFHLRFAVASMALGVFATSGFTTLISIYVRDSLKSDASTYGTLGTFLAAGTLAGGSMLARFGRMNEPEAWIAGGQFAVGAFIALVTAIPNTAAAFVAFFGIGVGAAFAMSASATLLQHHTPDALRGRVSALSGSLLSVAQVAAMLGSGGAAAWLGIRIVYAISAALLLSLPAFRCFRR
jgi:MFS transporter, DHA3 family, macrolide efflux protein